MKKVFAVFTLAFLPLVLASGQTTSERPTETEVAAPTVSPDDLRDATNEVKSAIRKVEEKSADQAEKIIDQTNSAVDGAKSDLRKEFQNLSSNNLDETKKAVQEAGHQATMRSIYIALAGVAIIVILGLIGFLSLRKHRAQLIPISRPELVREEKTGPMINPRKQQILDLFQQGATEVKFTYEFPAHGTKFDGMRIECRSVPHPDGKGKDPWVYVGNDPRKVTWKNHPGKALEVAEAMEQVA